MQLIAHVFPGRSELTRHLNEEFCEDRASTIDKLRNVYTDHNGFRHYCFVVRERDDVLNILGFEFDSFHLHGPFENLDQSDLEYMKEQLTFRTHKPGVAAPNEPGVDSQ